MNHEPTITSALAQRPSVIAPALRGIGERQPSRATATDAVADSPGTDALDFGTGYGTVVPMGRTVAEILEQARRSSANVRFRDLCRLVEAIGYASRRQKGSHHVFTHVARPGLPIVNLQSDGTTAKVYQVRQVVRLIDEQKLEVKP